MIIEFVGCACRIIQNVCGRSHANSMQVDSRCSPRKFAQEFIKSLRERAEKVPNAGQRAGSGKVIKLGSDCTGLSSDFVALKFALGASVKLQTAFISDTWLVYYQLKF